MPYVFDNTVSDTTYDSYFGNSQNNGLGIILTGTNSIFFISSIKQLNLQIFENLKTLLLTRKGERYGQPQFGTDLYTTLFSPNTNDLKAIVHDAISDAVTEWLPYISLDQIDVKTAEDDPSNPNYVTVKISYSVQNFGTNNIVVFVTPTGELQIDSVNP
jgi:phage baseplate assembly protein W